MSSIVPDRDAHLADLAARERVIGVVSGLGREIEGDREPRLTLGEVGAVELVAGAGGGVSGIGPEDPGPFAFGSARGRHPSLAPQVADKPTETGSAQQSDGAGNR